MSSADQSSQIVFLPNHQLLNTPLSHYTRLPDAPADYVRPVLPGSFRPLLRQQRLEVFGQALVLWKQSYLLAELLAAGWLPGTSTGGRPLSILEVGACIGLPSLVAAHLGHSVLATEVDLEAVALMREQAHALKLDMKVEQLDLRLPHPSLGTFDILMVAGLDMLSDWFEEEHKFNLICNLRSFCNENTRVLIVDFVTQRAASYYKLLAKAFHVVDEVSDSWLEERLWIPRGYGLAAKELRPLAWSSELRHCT